MANLLPGAMAEQGLPCELQESRVEVGLPPKPCIVPLDRSESGSVGSHRKRVPPAGRHQLKTGAACAPNVEMMRLGCLHRRQALPPRRAKGRQRCFPRPLPLLGYFPRRARAWRLLSWRGGAVKVTLLSSVGPVGGVGALGERRRSGLAASCFGRPPLAPLRAASLRKGIASRSWLPGEVGRSLWPPPAASVPFCWPPPLPLGRRLPLFFNGEG